MIPSQVRFSSCWPTAQQELLLKAAISEPEDASAAWNRWISQVDISTIDQGSYRILPLVYRRLGSQLESDPRIQKLKGVYRRTWYKNQMLFFHMAKLVQMLESSGVRTLILKGAALVPLYYKDPGLRPMDDFDILVHPSQARDAIRIVLDQGFSPQWRLPKSLTDEYLRVTDEYGFTDTGDLKVEIHWYAIAENTGFDYDEDWWHTAVPLLINGVGTLALDATYQLLHLCAHGIEWNTVPSIRWICDSLIVLDSAADTIDWPGLFETTKGRRLVLPIRSALKYLKSHFVTPITGFQSQGN